MEKETKYEEMRTYAKEEMEKETSLSEKIIGGHQAGVYEDDEWILLEDVREAVLRFLRTERREKDAYEIFGDKLT